LVAGGAAHLLQAGRADIQDTAYVGIVVSQSAHQGRRTDRRLTVAYYSERGEKAKRNLGLHKCADHSFVSLVYQKSTECENWGHIDYKTENIADVIGIADILS